MIETLGFSPSDEEMALHGVLANPSVLPLSQQNPAAQDLGPRLHAWGQKLIAHNETSRVFDRSLLEAALEKRIRETIQALPTT